MALATLHNYIQDVDPSKINMMQCEEDGEHEERTVESRIGELEKGSTSNVERT